MNFEDIIRIEIKNIKWVTGTRSLLQILQDLDNFTFKNSDHI